MIKCCRQEVSGGGKTKFVGREIYEKSGRTALTALLRAEQDREPVFWRLANALSALYPKPSEEKRLLDAMLLTVAG